MISSSVFFIPTNRDATGAIESYAREIRFARERFGAAIPLVVSETDDGPAVAANARALAKAARRDPELVTHHLTVEAQRRYFEPLLAGEPAEVADPFLSGRRDYGTAMNKLFLMTCSFGADALHRRDSDTRLLEDELPGAAGHYPIEFELSELGRTLPTGDRILVVGGNYYGEWNLDVKDLARKSYGIVHRLYELLGFDPESVPEIVAEAFPEKQEYLGQDTLTVVTSVNDGLNPDCGNVAVTGLHEYLPNVPGRNMLAADYFTFDRATALGIASLHHTRAVFHTYTSGRFEPSQKIRYWEGVARFADYFSSYRPLFEPTARDSGDLLSAGDLRRVTAEVAALSRAPAGPRAARIRGIAEEVLIPLDERYAEIGHHLLANAERYVRECSEDYAAHSLLLERWPILVERARNLDLPAPTPSASSAPAVRTRPAASPRTRGRTGPSQG